MDRLLFSPKALALWADAFYKLICPYLCLSMCVFVWALTFEVPLKRLFAPTSQSQMSKNFRDLESVGKRNVKKWSYIWKLLLIKKSWFLGTFCKDQEVIQQGLGGFTTRIRRLYNKYQKVIQQGSGGYYRIFFDFLLSVLLSPLVGRGFVSRMRDFFFT